MRVHVLGAGIVGLACADELQRRGHDVAVVDPAPGSGATYAAAGMLSPAGEAWYGEPDVHRLGLRSAAMWPEYADRLGVPLQRNGTLLVGLDPGDLQQVQRQADLLAGLGVAVDLLDGREARRLEPTLARVAGAATLPDDHSVAPRAVVAALMERVPVTAAPPDEVPDLRLVATGACLPEPWRHLVHGVRGEILRARTDDPPTRVLRSWVRGEPVYVVPRPGGEVVVGATVEEHDEPPVATLGGVERLLTAARQLVPGLDRAELLEVTARDRPATADRLPLVGPVDERTWLAAGHFRHGVLLAPLTAQLVADGVEGGAVDPALDPRRLEET